MRKIGPEELRSRDWFDDMSDPVMTALYVERYLNFGLTEAELRAGRPLIGIAQSGSDLAPCNRHHLELAARVRDGIRDAGGVPLEFPVHPIQETGRRPTAALDRNLQCIGLIEILHGYPLDGVVLMTGCDKTTPAQLMAAASVDLPAIALSVGPMLNGEYNGRCVGAGAIIWELREKLANGEIDAKDVVALAARAAPSAGHCNTMGTALTMNILVEALGMALPGCASIPAPYRERQQIAYETGRRIVDMVWSDLTPSDILTRDAFENAMVACAAIGGSTNAPIHIAAIAAHAGLEIDLFDWDKRAHAVPLLVNCRPAGEYLAEDFHKAGGAPAVFAELREAGRLRADALTINGKTIGENCAGKKTHDRRVIKSCAEPVRKNAGFMVLQGNFFASAIIKTCVISDEFQRRYLNGSRPGAFEATAVVFEGPEDYHRRIDDPDLGVDEESILIMRGVGPRGYPGAPEVVNMRPPVRLMSKGVTALPTMGDGRQSGTSAAPSILHVTPEAADGGGLALVRDGDRLRIDLSERRIDLLISDDDLRRRRDAARDALTPAEPQTWWQALFQQESADLAAGATFPRLSAYLKIRKQRPRHSH